MIERMVCRLCFPVVLLAAALLLGSLPMVGCGKKAPPKLPDVEPPAGVQDLAVSVEEEAVVLTWTAAADDETPTAGYRIYRSAEPVDGESCEGCPIVFRRVAEVPLPEGVTADRGLVYREALLPGTNYHFKVVPYDAQGRLGPDSNIARLVTER